MFCAVYVVISVMMNVFCMKALSFGSPVIVCDAGLLISWGVFLIANVIVEVWDKRTAMILVSFAAVVSFAIMVLARLIVLIPTLPEYYEQARAFEMIFSNGPRTIIASVTAFWIGNFINTHIIYKIRMKLEKAHRDRKIYFFARAAFSTLVGQLADNAIFMFMAFAPIGLSMYEMQTHDIVTAVLSGTVIELVVETFLVPFITIPLTGKIKAVKKKEEAA